MSGEGWRDRATNIGSVRDKKDIKVYGGRSFTLKAMLPGNGVKKVICKAVFEDHMEGFVAFAQLTVSTFITKGICFEVVKPRNFSRLKTHRKLEDACLIRIRKIHRRPNLTKHLALV